MSAHQRPEPLLTRAKVTAAISGLTSLLITLGVLPATLGAQINTTVEAVITAVGLVMSTAPVVVHAVVSRTVVTPVTDPRNDAGERLVPAGSAPASPSMAAALAAADAIYPSEDKAAPNA